MPKKGKKGKKKKGKKAVKLPGNETPEQVVKRLLKTYERNCLLSASHFSCDVRTALKNCIEDNVLLEKFIVMPEPVKNVEDPEITHVMLDPLVTAMRQERYAYMKDLYVWNIPLQHDQISSLALLLEKGFYPVRKVELEDCLIEPYSTQRLSISFSACPTLTTINLDYNEFGDEGCRGLCAGLRTNITITSLSMCYCGLQVESGKVLGDMVATSAVRDLYLDGNDLECEGVVELIKLCADHAETETYEKELEEKRKQEAAAAAAENQGYTYNSDTEKSRSGSASGKKKKKARKEDPSKKKKSKEPPPPPRVGPWIHKLHLADNGIDIHSDQGLSAPLICMRLFRKLMVHSDCFEELDLDDNLIGDLAGRELVEALLDRKEADLPGIKLRTTHRMHTDTFNNLIKLGAGMKKKKKKGAKKKKK